MEMHHNMFLLAERLVLAMEKMSEDVKNISVYVYDLSHSVSCILNENRGKEDISLVPCDDVKLPSDAPVAGEEASMRNEYSWRYQQADESSVSQDDVLEHEMSVPSVALASTRTDHSRNSNAVSSFPQYIKLEENGENDVSYSVHKTSVSGEKNVREIKGEIDSTEDVFTSQEETDDQLPLPPSENEISSRKRNWLSHIESTAASYDLQIGSSSSQSPSVEIRRINSQKYFSKKSFSSEHGTAPLRGLPCEESFAVASCSTEDTMGQGRAADNYWLEGRGENQSAGIGQTQHTHQSESDRNCYVARIIREVQNSASLRAHSERLEKEDKRRAFECSICTKTFSWKSHFIIHMRKHTGERPFTCSLCGKSFARKDVLFRHMTFHSEERPYVCTLCGKDFKSPTNLSQHRRFVHAAVSSAS